VAPRDHRIRLDLERRGENIGGFRGSPLLQAKYAEQMSRIEVVGRHFEDFTTQPFRLDQIARVLKGDSAAKSLWNARSFQARRRPPCVHDAPQTSVIDDRLAQGHFLLI
jgi:hypothetical protein